MPFFSIIIPLYNKENYIENTLKSIFNQNFTDYEIIIFNDGSSDRSEKRVLHFNDDRIKYYSQENKGVSNARNFGIKQSTGNYICLLDADDYWYPTFLTEFFKVINSYKTHQVFSCALEIEIKNKIFPGKYSLKNKDEVQIVNYFEASKHQSIISSSSVVFNRAVFAEIGFFDAQIKTAEDTDFWIRVGLKHNIIFINKILAIYKSNDLTSLSKLKKEFQTSLNYYKFAHIEKENLSLKIFLDQNRFSDAIKAKLYNDSENFYASYKAINKKNLSAKKRILLQLPKTMLVILLKIQLIFARIGIVSSVFR